MNTNHGIIWDETGLRLEILRVSGTSFRFLKISDLNPEAHIRRRLSRWETARIGLFFLWRALTAKTPAEDAT